MALKNPIAAIPTRQITILIFRDGAVLKKGMGFSFLSINIDLTTRR